MAGKRKFNSIVAKARTESWKLVRSELRAVLPAGWRAVFAVGWGLALYNDKDETVVNCGPYGEGRPVQRMPKGVRQAMELAAEFYDTFGPGNEVVESAR